MLAFLIVFATLRLTGELSTATETVATPESVRSASETETDVRTPDADERIAASRRLQTAGLTAEDAPETLWRALVDATAKIQILQRDLARLDLDYSGLDRELSDLRQFILDHDTYGDDFRAYSKMVEEARRKRRSELVREKQEREAERQKQRDAARQKIDAARGRKAQDRLYDERGFAPIGQDVYTGRAAFFYAPREEDGGTTVEYRPNRFGRLQPVTVSNDPDLDFSSMTISGSLLNADPAIRSIGVAFTFFDDHGNQVGAHIQEIQNARPNVPYPFTRKIDMALNRPFASHSTYVLYADTVVTP